MRFAVCIAHKQRTIFLIMSLFLKAFNIDLNNDCMSWKIKFGLKPLFNQKMKNPFLALNDFEIMVIEMPI